MRSSRGLRVLGWGAILVAAVVLLAATIFARLAPTRVPSDEELLRDGRLALTMGWYEEAKLLTTAIPATSPRMSEALLIAGEASTKLGRYEEALDYYAQVTDDGSAEALTALWARGELLLHLGRLSEAERHFRRVLERDPKHALAHRRLAFVLGVQGRRWESLPHLFTLLKENQFELETLLFLGNTEHVIDYSQRLQFCLEAVPDDPLPLLGLVRIALRDNEYAQAEQSLQQILAAYPQQVEALARRGAVLLRNGFYEELLQWEQQLPQEADAHPEVWIVRGFWAQDRGEPKAAARCFWEAVRRDPNHQVALYQLAQLLATWGKTDQAELFLDRHRRIDALLRELEEIYRKRDDITHMAEAAELTESLGRLWEAWGWYTAIAVLEPQAEWARESRDRLHSVLRQSSPPRNLLSADPAFAVDLSMYPLPQWHLDSKSPTQVAADLAGDISFEDLAAAAGLNFTYFNSPDPETEGKRMYEFAGGGIAVLDFDGNGWPDLYFTQGCPWPPDPDQTQYRNRLFRNLGNGQFQDVTAMAGAGDNGFGQGVAVGDFNNDGFPDIYVANIGVNRLYRNNGDGTFTDVTDESGITSSLWTTSCLVADLNGNGLPDLYDVNYLTGEDIFSRRCQWRGGKLRICGPATFQPEQDQLLTNTGHGRFENQTDAAGITLPGGVGLGIVAGDFDGSGKLSLFVANDQTANFFLINQEPPGSAIPRFQDHALLSGLAYDRDGKTQACMGVAAGDVTGNGLLDLFVTNFFQESNTLYVHQPGQIFVDHTHQAGLRDPSFSLLGWGAQFLDSNLNGHLDLVLTNGHLDDFTYLNQLYEMPPQFFRNLGGGTFTEVPAESLGSYFQGVYLGRALARLDWNRDGLEDFVVLHLDAPVALLTNQTQDRGHFLAVQLRGVQSARDAIGTVVQVTAGDLTLTRQLTAGDGYQVSNQRQLVFGLGENNHVDEMVVRWPSGLEQTFRDLSANVELILVEGQTSPVNLPKPR